MTILVETRNVYGNERIYPKSHSKALESLTSQKTLSKRHIEALKELGFQVLNIKDIATSMLISN